MSEEQPLGGRSRGRARGRARGQTQEPARRPGVAPITQVVPPPPPTTGGRASHRGGARSEVQPGEGARAPTAEMAMLRVGSGTRGRFQDEPELATRPAHVKDKKGTSGNVIKLLTNFFRVVSRPDWCVYQYRVDFSPTVESIRMRRALLYDHKELLGSFLFDSMSDLMTITKLPDEITNLWSERRTDHEKIKITLKWSASLAPDHPDITRLFNTQMRRNLYNLRYHLIGRHYFDPDAKSYIANHGLEVWQGVITSIRQQERSVMMLVDTVHKVLRRDSVHEQLSEISRRSRGNHQEDCCKEIVGSIIMTRYNTKTYRIDDIDWSVNPTDKFETREGFTTYVDYYKKQYGLDIKDRAQPLLICRSKEKELRKGTVQSKQIYLIPEFCSMTGLTEQMRNDFSLTKDLSAQTRIPPDTRVKNLETFIQRVNSNPTVRKEMGEWGLQFDPNIVSIDGRVLPPEAILLQGNSSVSYDPKTADFSREMRSRGLFSSVNLEKWLIICCRRDQQKCDDFMENLRRVCPPMGMRVSPPRVRYLDDDRTHSFLQELIANYSPDLQLAVFIVPNNRKDRYDAIKKMACIDHPVASQVIVARTLAKKVTLMSVATKIGIQLNCKMGGEAWAVNFPLKMTVMIVGYDAYHDSSKKGCSAGGFVASMNKTFTKWFSKVSFHSVGAWHELSDHLHVNMTAALKEFYKYNRMLPETIIFYRDGVGDGQIRYVKEYEVDQIKTTFNSCGKEGTYNPKFGFIVVNKRIGTRFFLKDNGSKIINPRPGTVIDDEVTRFDRYDFFLVSQSVRQGTVSPTQYNVIVDTTGLRPDHIQRLTYKLTHLYYNWPGTIRVPAPCQYAHKLAFLSGQSLHREPSDKLSDKLFYL